MEIKGRNECLIRFSILNEGQKVRGYMWYTLGIP